MKIAILLLPFLVSTPALASGLTDLNLQGYNRYFCYYRDSQMGYRHGGGGRTIRQARNRAYQLCHEALRDGGDYFGTCRFVGCRRVR